MSRLSKFFGCGFLCLTLLGAGCSTARPAPPTPTQPVPPTPTGLEQQNNAAVPFGASVTYVAPIATISPEISKDFDLSTIKNLKDMEKAYGFTFSQTEKNALASNKFVVKNLLDTNIRPYSFGDNVREFTQLYNAVKGSTDPHDRAPQNSLFFSSDVFFNAYNNLYTELLKEMENKTFYPSMLALSRTFYEKAGEKLAVATAVHDLAEESTWLKVRNYFAVPYIIFSNTARPLTQDDYYSGGEPVDPVKVMSDFAAKDAKVDTIETATAMLKSLKLDVESEEAILSDLKSIYKPGAPGVPSVFADEYKAYADKEEVEFKVDWTQFTPRSTYTSSSLRRQYFRGMKWFIMLPMFLKSPDLTSYSFAITQLMAENPAQLKDYNQIESAIDFLVGTSDDLMPVDYLQALQSAKGASDETAAAMDYLVKARNPMIKDLPAAYPCVGCKTSAEVLLKTKGMRFFSGKFIIDSYWTSNLAQGDEAIKPGYEQKLPPMVSSLEVMTLLGSDYAKSQLSKLDFYTPKYAKAIDKAVADLTAQTNQLTDADWKKNIYMGWMWTIRSMFGFLQTNRAALPRFMQSTAWEAKTLQTATAFWTELRHATLLYAKQSFVEMGAGGPGCDPRTIPEPPKAYIEPQSEAFARLSYIAKRTSQGLKDQGFSLQNMAQLDQFVKLMDMVQTYVAKELGNATLSETITQQIMPDYDNPDQTSCLAYVISEGSDWETLRLKIIELLGYSLPVPTEGPVLPAKDRRAALVADVHTGGDSDNAYKILYEGEGVPYVIFTAVKDANGPRLTVGFVSSQFEFTKPLGGSRLTDEEWQTNFYEGTDPDNAFTYTPKSSWPAINPWYAPIFGTK